ncbi:hypothetical protein JMJ56_27860 [Belnapia sp. T18]|uniref:Uncharacterized protein n=1 Tax=Belnapia arida TaxID=2804533 RepID=A0ABS1UCY3_9PROT|nr:hypothetical protein [Belnapia arida]MBL6081804.1 hypothetical protein [Belnapia arida]
MTLLDNQYRQGDVLLVAIDALPTEAEPVAFTTEPLALVSTASGPGSHLLPPAPGLRAYRRKSSGDVEWLELTGANLTLAHPEHAPIVLEPGIWRVVRQREYDPAAGHRRVTD